MTIYDLAGRTVRRFSIEQSGEGKLPIDLSELVSGVYLLRVEAEARSETHRFIIK